MDRRHSIAERSAMLVNQKLQPPRLQVMRYQAFCYPAHHPGQSKMIRCHLSTLMGRDKLRIADVSRRTGLNRSTITALYQGTTSRVDLPAIERLCQLFHCQVGDLFEYVRDGGEVNP
jgi:putative transcriptional regulator